MNFFNSLEQAHCQAQLQFLISVEIELSLTLMSIPPHHPTPTDKVTIGLLSVWMLTSVEDDLSGRCP